MSRRAPGQLESEVLATLWAASAPLTSNQVLTELGDGLAHTTVLTILSRLHAKGVLERTRDGRSYAYRPVADPAGLTARRMRQMLDAEDDRDSALAQFVSELDDHDEQTLRALLRKHRRTKGG